MRRFVFGFAMLSIATCLPVAAQADQQQDKQIAQQVIQRLQAEKKTGGLKGFNLDLQVEDGTLWMSGRVANKEQQDKALDIARRVPGVKQVVNDLSIAPPPAPAVKQVADTEEPGTAAKSVLKAGGTSKTRTVSTKTEPSRSVKPVAYGAEAPVPSTLYAPPAQAMPQPMAQQRGPVAFAPSRAVSYNQPMMAPAPAGQPQPMYAPPSGNGLAPARYDQPQLPGYAWPSYASHPNYAAVTYPKQYSASAWPYIGPFYPYPQVPLGWRKVSLEWDDGWWFLDFKDRH